MKKILRCPYVMRKVIIDKNNVDEVLESPIYKRKIRDPAVKRLTAQILGGEHFLSTLAISNRNEDFFDSEVIKQIIIDGNHRGEAIKEAIAKDPDFSIEVWIMEFKDLDIVQEKETFTKLNIGTKQSQEDFIQVNFDQIPQGEYMVSKIPCSVYGSNDKIKIKQICSAHIDAMSGKKFNGGPSISPEMLVSKMMEFRKEDVNYMSAFMDDMKEIFGEEYNSKNEFYKTTGIYSMYRLWYDNLNVMTRDKFIKTLHKIFFVNGGRSIKDKQINTNLWKDKVRVSGAAVCKEFYLVLLRAMRMNYRGDVVGPLLGEPDDDEMIEPKFDPKGVESIEKRMRL